MSVAEAVVADLHNESVALDAMVAGLPAEDWARPTPAPGWSVGHQIAHLWWTDRAALASITDEAGFAGIVAEAAGDPLGFVDTAAEALVSATPPQRMLTQWRSTRDDLHVALRGVADGRKLQWFGPPMSAASMATARLMETWAHGLDIADAIGVTVSGSARLKPIAHLGVRTRDFAFTVHGLTPPAEPFRVELAAPGGGLWVWGPEDAAQRVTGSALDFCHLVTQRRPRAQLDLRAEGDDARRWLEIAQAFAGPPGVGR